MPLQRTLCLALTLHVAPLAHAAESSAAAPKDLDKVEVRGRAQTLYRVDDAAVGTRTDTPLELVPQSIQVIPRELIDDQAARQVTDLYRSISGISYFSYAGVTLRGFRQENVLYDGLRGDPYAGFSVPQLFNIERVEVLRDGASAQYGSDAIAGVINIILEDGPGTEITAGYSQYAQGDGASRDFSARTGWSLGDYGSLVLFAESSNSDAT
ncbi:TonB-dependent receptor plug domain-containing protein, partial [Klebsiella pneumoniae]|uniref:TonB-dependent receptor plug domain-containing protein n=1 Tax=Klebsiella pneumoniae TaxID=573 RepID=UPI0037BF6BE7